jgi:twitching motility protein PilT
MVLIESLLTAIVRADGDALVMHVGEKPYVTASAGPVEVSSQGLNLQAMAGMVAQLLPDAMQQALTEFGAVEHELPSLPVMHGDRFTVVVARGGDDVWIEIRRHRRAQPMASAALTTMADEAAPVEVPMAAHVESIPEASVDQSEPLPQPADGIEPAALEPAASAEREPEMGEIPEAMTGAETETVADPATFNQPMAADAAAEAEPTGPLATEPSTPPPSRVEPHERVAGTHVEIPIPPNAPAAVAAAPTASSTASVIPMTRTLRIEVPRSASRPSSSRSDIERLLGLAAARNATALYLTTQASPFLRVDDDVQALEGEPPMSSSDVESAALELMPDTARDAVRRGDPVEWVAELPEIGRLRCSTFRDYRGPGAIFQLNSFRPVTAEQLGLNREIQALATETEGLVLVASPRGHGKSTLIGAFVDLINHQRSGYIITLERQNRLVHEHDQALISQREVRGTADQVLSVARAALSENADVLVIDDSPSAEVFQLALDAAGTGRLVIVSVTASSITAALTGIVELFPSDQRKEILSLLADRLRGAVAQVLLRKTAGGRVAAREVVLATSAVGRVLADGQLQDLPLAIDSGRTHGLASLTDSLVQLVRGGVIDAREAYRKTDDRDALLLALKRENVDTSLVERLA